MKYTKEKYLDLYRKLYFCRNYEDTSKKLFLEGKCVGFFHLAHGQEAFIVGIQDEMTEDDWLSPQWRGNSQFALKLDPRALTTEILGKKAGLSGGLAGSDHIFSKEKKVGLMSGTLGQGVALGVGTALAYKMDKRKGCVVIGIGDGEMNEGAVSEVMNMAAAWKLPIAFYIHNNGYGFSAPLKEVCGVQHLSDRGKGFGIPSATYSGTDVLLVKEVIHEALEKARHGEPTITEFICTRWAGHFIGDPNHYRDHKKVEEEIKKTDPIAYYIDYLLKNKIANEIELTAIREEQEAIVMDAFEYAINTPAKGVEDVLNPKLFYAK